MPTSFDPLRAAREELAGLTDVHRVLQQREHRCELAMSEAEQELNAIRKVLGFCRIMQGKLREHITQLEEQQR